MKFVEALRRVVARFRREIRAHCLRASEAERHRAHVGVVEHTVVEAHFVDVAAEGAAAWQHRADRQLAWRIETRLRAACAVDRRAVHKECDVAGLAAARECDVVPATIVVAWARRHEGLRIARARTDVAVCDVRHTEVAHDARNLAVDEAFPEEPASIAVAAAADIGRTEEERDREVITDRALDLYAIVAAVKAERATDDAVRLKARITHARRGAAGDRVRRSRRLRIFKAQMHDESFRWRRVGERVECRAARLRLKRANFADERFASRDVRGDFRLGIGASKVASHHAQHVVGFDRVERRLLVGRHSREKRGELVVLANANRIALVIVAARAIHRDTEERARRRIDDAVHVVGQRLLQVGHFVVPKPESVEARRDKRVEIAIGKFVASDLRADKPRVRHVGVERAHHEIAVLPSGFLVAIALETVGVGVADEVEPVTSPLLAVVRAREQPIDEPLVGVRRLVGDKRVDFRRCGRQARQVKRGASNERHAIGLGRWAQSLRFHLREEEAVDVASTPRRVTHGRRCWRDEFLVRPPRIARVLRAFDDGLFCEAFRLVRFRRGRLLRGLRGGGNLRVIGCG